MTHETTPDTWLTKRKHRIQGMLRDERITLSQHDIAIAQAKNIHSVLMEMNETGDGEIEVDHLGIRRVIVTGFHTDSDANIYVQFKVRANGGVYLQKLEVEE